MRLRRPDRDRRRIARVPHLQIVRQREVPPQELAVLHRRRQPRRNLQLRDLPVHPFLIRQHLRRPRRAVVRNQLAESRRRRHRRSQRIRKPRHIPLRRIHQFHRARRHHLPPAALALRIEIRVPVPRRSSQQRLRRVVHHPHRKRARRRRLRHRSRAHRGRCGRAQRQRVGRRGRALRHRHRPRRRRRPRPHERAVDRVPEMQRDRLTRIRRVHALPDRHPVHRQRNRLPLRERPRERRARRRKRPAGCHPLVPPEHPQILVHRPRIAQLVENPQQPRRRQLVRMVGIVIERR